MDSFLNLGIESETKPWTRLLARVLDVCIFSFIVGIMWEIISPTSFSTYSESEIVFGIIILFLWVFIEPIFLHFCGATFGKWLLKIKLRDSEGNKLTFFTALKRSFLVWFKCLAIGLPFIWLITYIISYRALTRNGISSWDKSCHSIVTRQKIGFFRLYLAVLLFFAAVFGSLLGLPVLIIPPDDLSETGSLIIGSFVSDPE